MESNMNQWKDQHQHQHQQQEESEEEHQHQHCAKIPRQLLFLETPLQQYQEQEQEHEQTTVTHPASVSTALPLFHDSQPITFSRVEGRYCFSTAQWQELQVQALIYRYMMAGAAVPPELLHFVSNTFLSPSTPYYLHHYPPPALMQAGYWGKGAMDPEPGRCRRTDGKKWRCSRDVMTGHKYCERHVHRGRSRSRKPVECPPPPSTGGDGSGSSSVPVDAFHLNQCSKDGTLFESQHNPDAGEDGKPSNSKVLMHLFDDWPRSLQQQPNNNPDINGQPVSSGTCFSMLTNASPTSDFLRLSTGDVDELGQRNGNIGQGWAGATSVGSMGGPLAEALRSSTNLSPTSVLHQLPRCSASDTSNVTA